MSGLGVFSINDMVFVENIGYGTLMDCGNLKSIPIKQLPSLGQKRQSIYFDPQLFNSQSQTIAKQKSQTSPTIVEVKQQQKKTQPNELKNQSQDNKEKQQQKLQPKQKVINIVKVRLQGCSALVYTPDKNIRKYVNIPIRPLFLPAFGTLNIKIQIGKTIQSLKRQIFDILGLKHGHYFNVKLFTTSPNLGELNCSGKTIWQYGLKQSSILTMTADHGFCFQSIPPNMIQYFSLTNNNLTFISLQRKPKLATNVVIPLPPPPTTPSNQVSIQTEGNSIQGGNSQSTQTKAAVIQNDKQKQQKNQNNQQVNKKVDQPAGQNKIKEDNQAKDIAAQKKIEVKQGQDIKQQKKQKAKQQNKQSPAKQKQQKIQEIKTPDILFVNGDKYFKSGRHYFQVRLDKLPQNSEHFQVGVGSGKRKWLYSPMSFQKIYEQESQVKLKQNYGLTFKQNDILGVLVKIDKHKNMKINFFKNSVNLGICFQAKVQQAFFIFGLGSEGQISLDSRVQVPVDSYRFR